jgi:anti-anti-sigma factor
VSDESPHREQPVLGVESVPGAIVVRLSGELDLYNADDVRRALAQAVSSDPERVVVDLTEVAFVDSTVLGVLIEAHTALPEGTLRLAAPQLETRRALLVSGLDRRLPVYDTVDEAVAAA